MSDAYHRPSLGAAVYYKDPFAALDWLEKAFGFRRQLVVTENDGRCGDHARTRGPVLRRSCLCGARPRGPRVELWPDCARGVSRRGGTEQRPENRRMGVI